MKVYVLNKTEDSERLKAFAANYPVRLPDVTVWKAKTGADVDVPAWWQSSANRWALVQNFIDILSQDGGEEDVLIFEDDCIFAKEFDVLYNAFLAEVPDDWDMLYLGAQHVTAPVQVSENILRLSGSICGHAIIYRNSVKQKLVDFFQEPNWGCLHMPDQRRAQGMASGKFRCYSPLFNLCGQAAGYSSLTKSDRGERWYNNFNYRGLTGKLQRIEHSAKRRMVEPIEPVAELSGKAVCSVSLYGENRYYAICFLMKQKELEDALHLPIVCHCDDDNYKFVQSAAEQEEIDLSNVVFVIHEYKDKASSMIWRYMPTGAATTHVFDVDNKLHPAHVEAVKAFDGRPESAYVCKYIQRCHGVLGGAVGIREPELSRLFNYWNELYITQWGYDEQIITDWLVRHDVQTVAFRLKDSPHVTPKSWNVELLDYNKDTLHYTKSDFAKLRFYKNGQYFIGETATPVYKIWRR